MNELMIKIDNVSKKYILGQIGGTTLRDELQRWGAKLRHKEDPTRMIGAKNYNKGETFLALDGVSVDVKKGERVGIIGHNGAGKSTLLKLVSRVTAPTSGVISLNGRIASMLEVGTGFHPELTGRENIYMNGAILGMTKKEIDAKMEDIIEFSECRQFIDTPVKRYSSGMYVKLAFSVAAHLDSEIMIMDEVLAVGDMSFQQKCLDKMNEVSREYDRTILYVSHNMNTIRQLCNRCVVLDYGKVIFDGDVDTGIQYYSNNFGNMFTFNDLTEVARPRNLVQRVEMESLEILNRDVNSFNNTEKMELKLIWKSLSDLHDVRFRFIVKYKDTTNFGMMTTTKGVEAEKDQIYTTLLKVDLSVYATGVYYGDLYCYSNSGSGGVENFDLAGRAIAFEVVNNSPETGGLQWFHNAWGHAVLPEIGIE